MLDAKLLEILVCPVSKQPLIYRQDLNELWSIEQKLAYAVKDGIPVLIPAEARELNTEEIAQESGGA